MYVNNYASCKDKPMNDLISVIIPAYNVEKTLEKCINSIILSDYKNIEILIIDDSSTDNTLQICKKMQELDSRVQYYTKENSGAGNTRDFGLRKAKGKYFAFVDADDYIEKDMYSTLYRTLKKYNADICYCGYKKVYNDGRIEECIPKFEKECYVRKEILNKIIHNTVYMSNAHDEECMNSPVKSLYSMKLVKNNDIHFLSERLYGAEDAIFNFQMLSKCERIAFVHESFYNYIIYDYSLSHNPEGKASKMIEDTTQNWYKFIHDYAKEVRVEKYIIPYLNTEYLGRFRSEIDFLKNYSNFEEIYGKYNEIKSRYEYLSQINVWKTKGSSIRKKVSTYIMINKIKWYWNIVKKNR